MLNTEYSQRLISYGYPNKKFPAFITEIPSTKFKHASYHLRRIIPSWNILISHFSATKRTHTFFFESYAEEYPTFIAARTRYETESLLLEWMMRAKGQRRRKNVRAVCIIENEICWHGKLGERRKVELTASHLVFLGR